MSAFGPTSLFSPVNPKAAIPYYQAWPQYSVHDLYLNFHSVPLSSPGSEFLKFQHYLMARAPIAYYNNANVFSLFLARSRRRRQLLVWRKHPLRFPVEWKHACDF